MNYKWILPGLIECLSGLSHEDWLTTPFTSNGNETQHHWTNSQTGIGLNAKECILRFLDSVFSFYSALILCYTYRAAKADHLVGQQFEAHLKHGILASNRTELSHRTDRTMTRTSTIITKAQRASSATEKVRILKEQLAIAMAEKKVHLLCRLISRTDIGVDNCKLVRCTACQAKEQGSTRYFIHSLAQCYSVDVKMFSRSFKR